MFAFLISKLLCNIYHIYQSLDVRSDKSASLERAKTSFGLRETLRETYLESLLKLLIRKNYLLCVYQASYTDVLRLVTRSSPRTSAQRTGHFRSLAVSLCFKRTNPLFC